ncbi:MAG: hypothetical protein HY369_02730 [Candidatus Aenigmarchaeota archaeon]|nr:hypothetical protein [Candidatus Aenigmarchaeota archaeon]
MRFLPTIIALLLLPSVQALQIADGLFFTLPPESIACVEMTLPDDAGIFLAGAASYNITSDAVWGDLTQQLVTTDENNTVTVPICFSSFGVAAGECAPPHTITIHAPQASKSFSGGVCVSLFGDVDISPEGGEPGDVLNSEADLFDIGFATTTLYVQAGQPAQLTLLAESYANLTLEVTAQGLTPGFQTVALSADQPFASLNFTASAPGAKLVTANVAGCAASLCSKTATAEVIATDADPVGFTATLFPLSINVKDPGPVQYELTIENFGDPQDFTISLVLEDGLTSGFQSQVVTVAGQEAVSFEVTPLEPTAFYEVVVLVTPETGSVKKKVAYLSTDEFVTDAENAASPELQNKVDAWYATYATTPYGDDLEEYVSLQDALAAAVQDVPQETPAPGPLPPPPPVDQGQPFPIGLIAGAGVAAVVVVLAVLVMRRRKPAQIESPELER